MSLHRSPSLCLWHQHQLIHLDLGVGSWVNSELGFAMNYRLACQAIIGGSGTGVHMVSTGAARPKWPYDLFGSPSYERRKLPKGGTKSLKEDQMGRFAGRCVRLRGNRKYSKTRKRKPHFKPCSVRWRRGGGAHNFIVEEILCASFPTEKKWMVYGNRRKLS